MEKIKLPLSPQRITTGFAFSYVERALQESLANRQFGQEEMKKVIEFFGLPLCVYCGSTEIKRWDHLVAVKNGGETAIGNMVPACAKCDDSKRDIAFDVWMQSDYPNSPKSRGVENIQERIEHIYAYMMHFEYKVRPLETRLTPDELIKLENVRKSIRQTRNECEDLILSFRIRNNNKA
jgi:hypothetical protein